MRHALLAASLLLSAQGIQAHDVPPPPEPMPLDQLLSAFGWNLDEAEIGTEEVTDSLHVIFGLGGNIAVSTGEDGVLIVDDQFPQLIPQIKSAISDLEAGGDVDFVINTHWHFDHADGNLALGPEGTWIVAHKNSRDMMQRDNLINLVAASYEQKAYPESALPDISFKDSMSFHLNGEDISLHHFGPAHTTGDTAVIFSQSNAVHLGDVFNNAGYPFIDAGNGGSLEGVIAFCRETLKLINQDTVVIPGHGPVTDHPALVAYVDMLATIHERLAKLVESGASLEEVYKAEITKDWDETRGDSTGFVNRSYLSVVDK